MLDRDRSGAMLSDPAASMARQPSEPWAGPAGWAWDNAEGFFNRMLLGARYSGGGELRGGSSRRVGRVGLDNGGERAGKIVKP